MLRAVSIAFERFLSVVFFTCIVFTIFVCPAHGGVPIPGLGDGPTPFQWLFATGFSGSYNTFGSGTTAGAIGNYGRFVSGGASGPAHGYH